MNATSRPDTRYSPSGGTPVIVRIEMLALFTDVGSTLSEKEKRSLWFSAISLIEQPVWLQPRSQLMMQNDCPPRQRMLSVDVEPDPPPEHPAAAKASRPETIAKERVLLMGRGIRDEWTITRGRGP